MKCRVLIVSLSIILITPARGQEIAFVSDTQAPMWIENVFLKSNQNTRATRLIFEEIVKEKPKALFILGDVVSLGYKEKKWRAVDRYLDTCRSTGIYVTALLGNHDVMTNAKKGEKNFQKRFADHVRTGYVQVVDSVAVILLNSNFSKMEVLEIEKQQAWFAATAENLDRDPAVKIAIVACHHAPYTNSKIVGSSVKVQEHFVPIFNQSKKCRLFVTGHAHAFEHFRQDGKDFLTIGGGGGLHQPLATSPPRKNDLSPDYKPMFHYLLANRVGNKLQITSRFLKDDFSGFEPGAMFIVSWP